MTYASRGQEQDKMFATRGGENDDESSESTSCDDYGWIGRFMNTRGHEFFLRVEDDYIQDRFNLTGIMPLIPYYEYALAQIQDRLDTQSEDLSAAAIERIEDDSEMCYGLIHARYCLTSRGLHQLYEKYRNCHFGVCPRYYCRRQPLLPCGLWDEVGRDYVKLFCPKCEDIYEPPSPKHREVDGAYFGTTLPHLFLLVYPDLKPEKSTEKYSPSVFGFKLHKTWHERSLEAAQEAHELYQLRQQQQQQHQQAQAQAG